MIANGFSLRPKNSVYTLRLAWPILSPFDRVGAAAFNCGLLDLDRHDARGDGRIVRNVQMVAEQHLQRMPARRERELHLRLAAAEMPMLLVIRDRQAEIRRQRGIDEQMMVARIVAIDAGRRHADTLQTEHDANGARDASAVGGLDDVGRRRRRARVYAPARPVRAAAAQPRAAEPRRVRQEQRAPVGRKPREFRKR